MKNTKGPWSFDFHGINQAGTGLRIAKLSQPAYDHSSGMPERIESFDADGYLMAAAPDMLETLDVALVHVQLLGSGQAPVNSNAEMCTLIGEAIAKAKGGTNV